MKMEKSLRAVLNYAKEGVIFDVEYILDIIEGINTIYGVKNGINDLELLINEFTKLKKKVRVDLEKGQYLNGNLIRSEARINKLNNLIETCVNVKEKFEESYERSTKINKMNRYNELLMFY